MSLFISTENQQLLYGMIHKTQEINVFSTVEEKNVWFRSIIESFFKKLPATITRDKLKEVNREVLGYMMNSLSSLSNASIQKQQPRLLKREQPIEPREYTTFYDLPKPKIIDFSEKIEDPVITNMEELIEQQKRMRERELQEYAPPPIVPGTDPTILATGTTENVRMKILEELPKTVLPLEKHVQFEDPTANTLKRIMESLDKINTRIEQIEEKVNQLVPPKVADPVGFLKNLISGEPTVLCPPSVGLPLRPLPSNEEDV
jgi:tetrahydromethanopterin S-methyltransferase subunit G